jgi:hypothetical protein
MPKLTSLRPNFYRSVDTPAKGYLTFDCPMCSADQEHRLTIATLDGRAVESESGVKRWGLTGSPPAWESVSLSPSIALMERCGWHGFVTNGDVA